MKRLIITLTLLQTFFMFGQPTVDGTFCGKVKFSGQRCLTFKSDSAFTYETKSCKTTGKGRGKYSLLGDTLNLKFMETDTAKNSVVIEKIDCASSDSLTLKFHVTELETKLPVSYADIWFSKGDKVSKYYNPDLNGNLIIKLSRSKIDPELSINIKIAMHNPMSFKVSTTTCNRIDVVLETQHVSYQKNGEIWKYKLVRHTRQKLVLRGENGYKYKYKKLDN